MVHLMNTLRCYLKRADGEWFYLGVNVFWGTTIAVFPGPPDGSTRLLPEDTWLLALRIEASSTEASERIAAEVIAWASGQFIRYVNELDPELEPDVPPMPITGSLTIADQLACGGKCPICERDPEWLTHFHSLI